MKNVSNWIIGAITATAAFALPAQAYNDVITHPELTHIAFEKSNLSVDPALMQRLGLEPWKKSWLDIYLRAGAWYEDRDTRGMNHFFDPIDGKGLSFVGFQVGKPSPSWVLGDDGVFQSTSIAEARKMLTRALTFNDGTPRESYLERQASMGNFFIYLAAGVHHLQDMAQPQHVRNDDHLDADTWSWTPIYDPSRYESYTRDRLDHVQSYGQMGAPVFPGTVGLTKARDFWRNDSGTGIAEYTNPRFLSKGTNFRKLFGIVTTGWYSNPKPGSPTSYTVQQLFDESNSLVPPEIQTLCGSPATGCTMVEYPASYNGFTIAKASTYSIYDQDLSLRQIPVSYEAYPPGASAPEEYSTENVFSLNRFNFDAIHQPLLSTAVGYSAGFLNHFFRGKLEVGPPDAGPYAAVDHSTGEGFTTIKAKVTNATKDEALDGKITAIARFRLNDCYKADLTGEFQSDDAGNLITPCPQYRSAEEHIRVASAQSFTFGPDGGKEYTFQFSSPIPVNATDLVLQVYFEGKVGAESGAFAVGMADLSEPTFISVLNATDMFSLPTSPVGTFVYWRDIAGNIDQYPYTTVDVNHDLIPDVNVAGGSIAYTISVDGKQIGQVTVTEGRFARVAVLVKPTTFKLTLLSIGNGFFSSDDYFMPSKIGQVDPSDNVFYVSVVNQKRKQAWHYGSVTFYHYYITANAPLSSMNVSKDPDATTLVKVTMQPASIASPSLAPQQVASLRESPSAFDLPRVDLPAPPRMEGVAPARSGQSKLAAQPLEVSATAAAE